MDNYFIVSDEAIVRIRSGKTMYFIFEDQIKKDSDPFTSLVMAPISLLWFIASSTSPNLKIAREIARELLRK